METNHVRPADSSEDLVVTSRTCIRNGWDHLIYYTINALGYMRGFYPDVLPMGSLHKCSLLLCSIASSVPFGGHRPTTIVSFCRHIGRHKLDRDLSFFVLGTVICTFYDKTSCDVDPIIAVCHM